MSSHGIRRKNPYIVLDGYTWAGLGATLSAGQFQHVNAGDNTKFNIKLKTQDNLPFDVGDIARLENAGDTEWAEGKVASTSTLSDAAGASIVLHLESVSYGDESDFNVAPAGDWRLVRLAYQKRGESNAGNLPSVSAADNNKILKVVNGVWTAVQEAASRTFAQIATGLNALTGNSRLSYNALKDTPAASGATESTQSQAEDGTDDATANDTRMTPRRTKQAIEALQRFSAADETKLDGIEAGAQKNSMHIIRFAAQDAGTYPSSHIDDGEIGFFADDGTTQHQSGDVAGLGTIYLPKRAAAYGQKCRLSIGRSGQLRPDAHG